MTSGTGTPSTASPGDSGDLNYCPLFRLSDPTALAKLLDVSLPSLWRVGRTAASYRSFETQTGGKQRAITAPSMPLEQVQRQLWDYLTRVRPPSYVHSGVRGRSYVTHASLHLGERWLCKIDMRSFYLQITAARVRRFFLKAMLCSPPVAALLTHLCTVAGHVPVGARISQPLSLLVTRPMFDELDTLATAQGNLFSLYLDDLCFSGDKARPSFLWTVKQTIHRHGYAYHAAKCYRPEQPRSVAGAVVTAQGLTLHSNRALWLQDKIALVERTPTEAELTSLLGHLAAASNIDPRYKPAMRRVKNLLRKIRLQDHRTG